MDIKELLSYKGCQSGEDELTGQQSTDKSGFKSAKRRKLMEESEDSELTADSVAAEVDETALKRLLLQFERKVLKNQELRIKFGDNPTKFLESEMELFDTIQEMHVLSTQPDLYHIIVELNIISTLLGLLSHENTDISCAVVALLHELTDLDDIQELNEVSVLLEALIDGQVIALLVTNMERLDETVKEESEGVYNSLGILTVLHYYKTNKTCVSLIQTHCTPIALIAIIENFTDYKPDLNNDCQPLIAWILKRLKSKPPFDGNKLYSSEILSILLQNNDENRKLLGELDGVDTLLRVISYYKRHDPSGADEHEYMENLFNCLCSALLCCPSNRELFFKGEGIELMNLILREKRKKGSNCSVRVGSLKVINHCLSSDKAGDNMLDLCSNKFIEILGLRVLMPVFMKPNSIVGHKKELNLVDEVEEHCLSIILALLTHSKPELKRRVLAKFVESDFEKTDRLIELHFKYAERLIKCDSLIQKERALKVINDEPVDEDELFMRRLTDGGLFTLQIIDHIVLLLCSLFDNYIDSNATTDRTDRTDSSNASNKESVKSRVMKLINLHAISSSVNHYKFIKNIMKALANERPDDERHKLFQLIDEF